MELLADQGTLGYEAAQQMKNLGIGISTSVGIGGDPINGSSFKDILEKFEEDKETDAVLMIGEIGGTTRSCSWKVCKRKYEKTCYCIYCRFNSSKRVGSWDMLEQLFQHMEKVL